MWPLATPRLCQRAAQPLQDSVLEERTCPSKIGTQRRYCINGRCRSAEIGGEAAKGDPGCRNLGTFVTPLEQTSGKVDLPIPARTSRERVPVEGVRRVWGTLKATSTTAVASTLQKLTTVGNQILVRKKTRSDTNRWWFLLKGTEPLLCKLESEWDKVSLQTNWKLEPCTKPSDSVLQTPSTSNNAPNLTAASTTLPNLESNDSAQAPAAIEDVQSQSTTPSQLDINHSFSMAQSPHQVT